MRATLAFLLAFLISYGCQSQSPALERAKRAEKYKGPVIVGAAAPWSSIGDHLWEGIEMAVKEINGKGGVLGRELKVIKKDDKGTVTDGLKVAQSFADNPNLVAVIGHYNSYISIPASIIYEYYGILMLSPLSTAPKLTKQGFKLIFRNIPTDEDFGKRMADFCRENGLNRVVLYHSKNVYGESVANAFEKRADEIGIEIVDRMGYDSLSKRKDFRNDLMYWKEDFSFDALVVAGVTPQAAEIVLEARNIGMDEPIIGSDGLDTPELIEIAGKAAEGVYVMSTFDAHNPDPLVQSFVDRFKKLYGFPPDGAAAQGYDAVKVLAYAMEKAGSINPFKIADALHKVKGWKGVTGVHNFNQNGDVVGKPIIIKVVKNGEFVFYK